jgi:hypothetical protein
MSKFDRYAKLLFSNIANPQQSNSNLSNQPSSPSHLNLLPADGRSKQILILIFYEGPQVPTSPQGGDKSKKSFAVIMTVIILISYLESPESTH